MSRRTPSNTEARQIQGAGFYDTDGQKILNVVQRDPIIDAAATETLVFYHAADLLDILGLK